MNTEQKELLSLKNKGDLGEYNLYKALQGRIDGKYLFNLHVPCGTSISEIDLVLIHKTGLYVFECKNYRGKIYGSDNDEYWVSKTRNGAFSFYNPIKQNEGHIRALKSHLDIPMYNIVAFSNTSILNVHCNNLVTQINKIDKDIQKIIQDSTTTINVDSIYSTLLPFSKD